MESIEAIEDAEANGISNGLFHNELIGKPIQLLPPVLIEPPVPMLV